MASTTANGITIEYETVGSPDDEPMLLVMGFGAQLVFWPPAFVEALAAEGFYVVIYDNRDVGLSTKFEGRPQYTLDDMADDGIGLLDSLGIGAAHIAGASMGGYIVQRMAIRYPDRVKSLCSIMSTTGDTSLPPPAPEISAVLVQPPAATRDEALELAMTSARTLASPGSAFDEAYARRRSEQSYDRCYHPGGRMRHALAIAAATNHTEQLGELDVPTVVIHGDADPLVNVAGGEATAKAIPGAELVIVPGMSHELPAGATASVVEAIAGNARRASAR